MKFKHMTIETIDQKKTNRPEIVDVSQENVSPYKERPASNRYVKGNPAEISADRLFSFFTAEVIKEDKEFSR